MAKFEYECQTSNSVYQILIIFILLVMSSSLINPSPKRAVRGDSFTVPVVSTDDGNEFSGQVSIRLVQIQRVTDSISLTVKSFGGYSLRSGDWSAFWHGS